MSVGEILIVDDSSTSRMIIQRCIEMAGIQNSGYRFAENGLDALAVLRTEGVGVIVTDINMPKMDGQTFLRMLKSEPRTSGIPVIIVSSIAEDGDAGTAATEALAVVKKPVSPAKMAAAFGGIL
jgi:two-component system, chemotaxis family, chemotaxis protein CheY